MEENKEKHQAMNITNNFEGAQIGKIVYNYGTINENHYGESKEAKNDASNPYEALLLQIIEPLKENGNGRDIFLPYRAGIEEGVLAKWSRAVFIQKTGIDVPKSSYSDWMKEGVFSIEEMEPYAEQFKQLKLQIENHK